MLRLPRWCASVFVVGAVAACGGNVVVDGRASGGGGAPGAGGNPSTTSFDDTGPGVTASVGFPAGVTGVGSAAVGSTGAGTICAGQPCGPGQICDAVGACVCAVPGEKACPDGCFDVKTSHDHCGACHISCEGAEFCKGGMCQGGD